MTASLLKYTFIQSFHIFLYCEILSGCSAAQVSKSLLHTTWIKLLPLAPLNFAWQHTSVFHDMQHQKALFFLSKKQNSLKITMFKYNDLQGIAGFFRQCPSLRIYHKPSKDEPKVSTFQLVNYFLSNSPFFHERFYCTAKKMATLYRLKYNSTSLLQKYIVNSVFSSFGKK